MEEGLHAPYNSKRLCTTSPSQIIIITHRWQDENGVRQIHASVYLRGLYCSTQGESISVQPSTVIEEMQSPHLTPLVPCLVGQIIRSFISPDTK